MPAAASRAPRTIRPDTPVVDDVLELQRLAGNQAVVSRLVVARQPPVGAVKAPGTTATPAGGKTQSGTPQPGTPTSAAPTTVTQQAAPPTPAIAWIEDLPAHVQEQIDTFSQTFLAAQTAARQKQLEDQRTANRTKFMETMRAFFGSDAATEAHFRDIQPMGNDLKYPLWAHVSTRERLLEVQEDLKAQKTPMPQTDVALGLRGDHLHPEGKGPGWFTHATGFAIDWKANAAPHMTDPRLIKLFETVTGGTPHFDLQLSVPARLDLIEKMGQGKAGAAESAALLQRIESEYNRLVANSETFKTNLPETSMAPLREVEAARTAVAAARRNLVQVRKKGAKKADIETAVATLATAVETFDTNKKDATARLSQIFEPWTKLLDAKIDAIEKVARDQGVDLGKLTGTFGFKELREKAAALRRKEAPLEQTARRVLAEVVAVHREALAIAARADAAKAWLAAPGNARLPDDAATLATDLDDAKVQADSVVASLAPAKTSLAALLPGAVTEPKPPAALKPAPITRAGVAALRTSVGRLPPRVVASADKLGTIAKPLTDLVAEAAGTARNIAERTAYREATVVALGGADKAGRAKGEKAVAELLRQKVAWLNLKGAKQALQTDAEGFVFKAADVVNPAITQLLGLMSGTRGGGVLTPDPETGGEAEARAGTWSNTHGFNLTFMKSMVRHGFELGVAWDGQSDTMHFELVEGRRLLESGGTRALVAGATLRASEAAAAEP